MGEWQPKEAPFSWCLLHGGHWTHVSSLNTTVTCYIIILTSGVIIPTSQMRRQLWSSRVRIQSSVWLSFPEDRFSLSHFHPWPWPRLGPSGARRTCRQRLGHSRWGCWVISTLWEGGYFKQSKSISHRKVLFFSPLQSYNSTYQKSEWRLYRGFLYTGVCK